MSHWKAERTLRLFQSPPVPVRRAHIFCLFSAFLMTAVPHFLTDAQQAWRICIRKEKKPAL